ncbi:MAG: hypothetical protein NTX50_32545 [Candidatus Sumerlaeota bacterium]|nr:hypothetical protein [Candidatus Sumerlaeota bacterium]
MKHTLLTALLLAPLAALHAAGAEPQPRTGLRAVPFNQVRVDDAFWSPRLETLQKVTIPGLLDLAETQGKIDNFAIVAGRKPGKIWLDAYRADGKEHDTRNKDQLGKYQKEQAHENSTDQRAFNRFAAARVTELAPGR